jgi:hypothetical protein
LRRALGLLGGLIYHDTGYLHTVSNRVRLSDRRAEQQASQRPAHHDRKPFGRFDDVAYGDGDGEDAADRDSYGDSEDADGICVADAEPVGQCIPDRGPLHRRRGHGRSPGRLALRARRGGDRGRSRKHRLSQEAHQGPLTYLAVRSLGSRRSPRATCAT